MGKLRLFIPIIKVDEERREVIGRATREEIDSDREVVEFEGSKRAFAKWTQQFAKNTDGISLGNIREMHRGWAAGKVTAWEADETDQSIVIATKIVDDAAWEKCRERVYTGFSIGGTPTRERREKRDGTSVNVIKEYELNEVSLVDNPASPSSLFSVVKADGSAAVPMGLQKMRELIAAESADKKVGDAMQEMVRRANDGGPMEKARAVIYAIQKAAGEEPDEAPEEEPDDQPDHEPDAGEEPPVEKGQKGTGTDAGAVREVVSVVFQADQFDVTRAGAYLRRKGYFRRHLAKSEDGARLIAFQAPDAKKSDPRELPVAKGVSVTTAVVSDDPRARFRAVLKRDGIAKAVRSEGGSIYAGMQALAGIVQAIDSELFESMYGTVSPALPDEEKEAVVQLTAAAEAVLEFIAGEFQQQLDGATSAASAIAAKSVLALSDIAAVRRRPILKQEGGDEVVEDEEPADAMMENLGKIHEIGHSLTLATKQMGAACKEGVCKQEGEDEEDPPAEEDDAGEADPDGGDAGDEPPAPAEGEEDDEEERRKVKPSGEMSKVLNAVEKVGQSVRAVVKRVDGIDERLKKSEARPDSVGRPVQRAEKSLGGATPSGDDSGLTPETCDRLAAEATEPAVKEYLIRKASTLRIKKLQQGE